MKPDQARAPGRFAPPVAFVRTHAALLGYALFTLVVFVVALLWSLPHGLIVRHALDAALAGAPVEVSFRSIALAPPNGYTLSEVRVTPAGKSDPLAVLREVTVRLPLAALLTADFRHAAFSGQAYGGDFSGQVRVAEGKIAAALEARSIHLEPALMPFVPAPGRVEGEAALSLHLSGDGRTTQSSQGEVSLKVRDLKLDQVSVRGFRLPDLAFPTVDAAAQIYGARLQVKDTRATGNDLDFSASGDVLLREPVQQSVLNLRMTIDVPPTAQPALRIATGLLPRRAPGEAPVYTLKGTIAAPVLR
jgi:type II secretion system protein N